MIMRTAILIGKDGMMTDDDNHDAGPGEWGLGLWLKSSLSLFQSYSGHTSLATPKSSWECQWSKKRKNKQSVLAREKKHEKQWYTHGSSTPRIQDHHGNNWLQGTSVGFFTFKRLRSTISVCPKVMVWWLRSWQPVYHNCTVVRTPNTIQGDPQTSQTVTDKWLQRRWRRKSRRTTGWRVLWRPRIAAHRDPCALSARTASWGVKVGGCLGGMWRLEKCMYESNYNYHTVNYII